MRRRVIRPESSAPPSTSELLRFDLLVRTSSGEDHIFRDGGGDRLASDPLSGLGENCCEVGLASDPLSEYDESSLLLGRCGERLASDTLSEFHDASSLFWGCCGDGLASDTRLALDSVGRVPSAVVECGDTWFVVARFVVGVSLLMDDRVCSS